MQKLLFESAWDRTLSDQDRNQIKEVFLETCHNTKNDDVVFTPLWQALNHKGELLVTVLVHNFGTDPLTFEQTRLQYSENQVPMAEHSFTLPALSVEPSVSTPWTFIFPSDSFNQSSLSGNGFIKIDGA